MTVTLSESGSIISSTANTFLKLTISAPTSISTPKLIVPAPIPATATQAPPIIAELAGLSEYVYGNPGVKIPDGWEPYMAYDGKYKSFYGACYIKYSPALSVAFIVR